MRRVLGIARLTFLEGIRMKIVLVLVVVMFFIVFRLPSRVEADDTVAGRLQTFLAWSLNSVSVLLGAATVFLSCWTLSNEIKTRSLQMVVTKPVSRLEILAGKWLGINLLNLLLLTIAGTIIYFFANNIRQQPVQFQRDAFKVRDTVWTARVAAEPSQTEVQEAWSQQAVADVQETLKEWQTNHPNQPMPRSAEDLLNEKMREHHEEWLTLQPDEAQGFVFENLPEATDDAALQVVFRVRALPLPMNETVFMEWLLIDPEDGRILATQRTEERSGDAHEFLFRARAVKNGRVMLVAHNPYMPWEGTKIRFDGEKPLVVYYRVGGFEMNYVRALAIIFCQLAFLSAIGLFFSVFVSFPIAAMCTFAVYLIGIAWPWWYEAIGGNLEVDDPKYDPYGHLGDFVRPVIAWIMHWLVPNLSRYDGVSPLIGGEYISYSLLGESAARLVLLGGCVLLLPGWYLLRRREIAEANI